MKLINVGFGNMVNAEKILAVVNPDAAPIKRLVSAAKENQTVIDATQGRRTKAVIILDGGRVMLSALQADTVSRRVNLTENNQEESEFADE